MDPHSSPSELPVRWRLPAGQRLVHEEFDDRVVLFDALVGSTHLLNATAAEALAIIEETPGLGTAAIHRELLARLELDAEALPLPAVEELLWRLEDLNLVGAG
jgi:PqqD family protein of HPr-rel-A system